MIQLIILDVDGTLTNGQIIYGNDGNEIKSFNVKDGLGIAAWIKLGKKSRHYHRQTKQDCRK